ncbi:spermidine synthase [Agrococcus jenensis]|uniref:spermidine synthase n=1 Tax=Agrococcus jenensis TaxID=46353 RepID=UPI000F4CECEA|nr:fused MFS/spermidine synthase [Agrococcus jenensis]
MEPVSTPSRRLSSGLHAEMRYASSGWQLVVDGTPQSHVDPEQPQLLIYEYVQQIGHVIDALPAGPITAVHLGAGALTLPRYVDATRPGSRQQVIELEPLLVELVREVAPLPRGASVRVRYGDAREQLSRLPAGLRGAVDLVIVDVFSGAQTPAHVTTVEFHALVRDLLAPTGVVVVNIADDRTLAFAKRQLAALLEVHEDAAALADPGMLKGRRFGNVVAVAGRELPDLDEIGRALRRDPLPGKVVAGAELRRFLGGASPARDADATPSPAPGRGVFG